MPTVQAILDNKGPNVHSIDGDVTVLDAALMMNEHKIGALVVTTSGRLEGIFTERDVLRRVIVTKRDPATTCVTEVMTTEVAFCKPNTTIEQARSLMKTQRIRHLPVVDDKKHLVGIISIGDLNAHNANNQEVVIQYLHEYIYGRT